MIGTINAPCLHSVFLDELYVFLCQTYLASYVVFINKKYCYLVHYSVYVVFYFGLFVN